MDKLPDQVLYYLCDAEQIFLAMLTHRWMEQTCRLWEDQDWLCVAYPDEEQANEREG